MLTLNLNEVLPNKMKSFEKLKSRINLPSSISELKKIFNEIPLNSDNEILINYINEFYHLTLRIEGRGDNLKFKAEETQILYDKNGPSIGLIEDKTYFEGDSLDEIILQYKNWLTKKINI